MNALRDYTVEGGRPLAADIEGKYLGGRQSVGQGRYVISFFKYHCGKKVTNLKCYV